MGTATPLGAQFDGEVDAFLILVLSVYVARSAGAWVLAIGAARYAFLAAGWLLPWMREQLPPRHWRKVVAATQGIVLAIAAADVLPLAVTQVALLVALALLAESFGRDVCVAVAPPLRLARSRGGRCGPRRAAQRAHPDADPCERASPPCSRSSPRWSSGSPSSLPTRLEPPHARRVRAAPARGPRRRRPGARPAQPRAGASWPGSSDRLSVCCCS